jgi:23S rRNA (guanine745-N1)-methyltransferase
LKKKIELAADFLHKHAAIFRCPLCHEAMSAVESNLQCVNHHRFDLSKKGTLYFLKHAVKSGYDQAMLAPRGRMIESGQYGPVLDAIQKFIHITGVTIDVGCGEGSFLHELNTRGVEGTTIGFDISKDGVYLASNQPMTNEAFWCVADLTNLPFADGSADTILNIFSPSHYREFHRVLKTGGSLVKIIPEENYLRELRKAFYPNELEKQQYSNQLVLEKFKEEMTLVHNERISYTFEVPEKRCLDLLEMSPLEWGVSQEVKKQVEENPPASVSIDVRLLVGKK